MMTFSVLSVEDPLRQPISIFMHSGMHGYIIMLPLNPNKNAVTYKGQYGVTSPWDGGTALISSHRVVWCNQQPYWR
jgi:hypothetical protein